MGGTTQISWCDMTFNPWVGCQKVSDGCKSCYAEALIDGRFGRNAWGPKGSRQRTSASNWRKPLQWNERPWQCDQCATWFGADDKAFKVVLACGPRNGEPCPLDCGGSIYRRRPRVFCASLADVFEENADLIEWQADLFDLIRQTENLDWQLLEVKGK